MLSKQTLKKIINSPTCTGWASQAAEALRMFVLLPLLLVRFDDVEVAGWLLFSSLAFFSNIINERLSIVFSRSIALAYGGATDLSPIKPNQPRRGSGEPNWDLIGRLYNTVGSLNQISSLVGVVITCAVGYSAVGSLVADYDSANNIWGAFSIVLIGQFLQHNFRRYAVALRGLDKVSLVNKWQAAFSLMSSAAGACSVYLGVGIVGLALIMQLLAVVGVVCFRWLLTTVEKNRFSRFSSKGWDRRILAWLWEPAWRGFVQVVANRGSVKVATIVYANHADAVQLSGVLLAMRVLEAIESVAISPITNNVPRFSKLLASGGRDELRQRLGSALKYSQCLLIGGCVTFGLIVDPVLNTYKAGAEFLPTSAYALLASLFVLVSVIRQSFIVSAIGNRVVAVGRLLFAFIISGALSLWLVPRAGVYGFAVSAYLPVILIVNVVPLKAGLALLNEELKAK